MTFAAGDLGAMRDLAEKIVDAREAVRAVAERRSRGERLVFTNGCFDILHPGHVCYLQQARRLGEMLLVGLNSDASVRRLKGPERPVVCECDRATVLAALESVDYVVLFEEDTPLSLIRSVLPDVLVKGGDWAPEQIVGREVVEACGGKVLSIPFVAGHSTTGVIERIEERAVRAVSGKR
ncbi:MAG: D-glycero-beta-D-manno-heptose 1-phosphate adenylyltransferase [Deferrisomatales bacterium]|nr:D-glycero-beta-D-manno-heptose 1-phosphate adenylyltransferase [Deferrisomatales bacterium]